MTMINGGKPPARVNARRAPEVGVVRIPRVHLELFDRMVICESGEQSSPSGRRMVALRRALGVFRIFRRSTHAAWRGTSPKRFMRIGSVLVLDHPSEDLLNHLPALGFVGETDSLTDELPMSAKVRTLGWIVVFFMTNFDVLVRFSLRYRARSRGEQLAFKSIVAYARGREALERFGSSAVMVSHDLGGPPYFLALAAQHAGVPVWLLLHDFPKPLTEILIRPVGAVVYASHDACQLRPQPLQVFVYPEPPSSSPSSGPGLTVGVALSNRAPAGLLSLASPFIELVGALEGVDEILVRPHPAAMRPEHLREGPRLQVVHGGPIEEFLGRCDLVILVGFSGLRWSAARCGVPAFEILAADRLAALVDLGEGPDAELRHVDNLLGRLDVVDVPSRDSCPDVSHVPWISSEKFFGIVGPSRFWASLQRSGREGT